MRDCGAKSHEEGEGREDRWKVGGKDGEGRSESGDVSPGEKERTRGHFRGGSGWMEGALSQGRISLLHLLTELKSPKLTRATP